MEPNPITILDGPYTGREIQDGRVEDYGQLEIIWHVGTRTYWVNGRFSGGPPPHAFINLRFDYLSLARRVARHVIRWESFPGDLPQANVFPCMECGVAVTDVPSARHLYPHRRGCILAY